MHGDRSRFTCLRPERRISFLGVKHSDLLVFSHPGEDSSRDAGPILRIVCASVPGIVLGPLRGDSGWPRGAISLVVSVARAPVKAVFSVTTFFRNEKQNDFF